MNSIQFPLTFDGHFTRSLKNSLDQVACVRANSKITDTEGRVIFEMRDVEVPAAWSQLAVDILVSKYFRKAGVPQSGHEVSIKQVIRRMTQSLRLESEKRGYFNSASAEAFEEELSYLLVHQIGSFNSPVWFNLGLYHEYGINGSGGNYAWNTDSKSSNHKVEKTAVKTIEKIKDAYSRPQCSACFIQSLDDDLMSIFRLAKNEARLFKYGSGTGTNFSKIRGRQEKLSGGGHSSGLMSFLEVLDRAAGATKSGGTTRRAAKMVILDMDHPEILDFITWKSREERKARALIRAGYSSDFNGEAYRTIAGQNSNNSVRVTDEFMKAVQEGEVWQTHARTTGEVVETFQARDLWRKIAEAAWDCADPGVQFDTTINRWHTCLNSGRIQASNPCSEFMFLDDTSCNLASINLVKFLKADGTFDVKGYQNTCRTFILAQEILVDLASYPTKKIAKKTHDFRPLGLGYANLGAFLMLKGIPYDSDAARAWASALTALLTGHAYLVSAELSESLGSFSGYSKNKECMLGVIEKHRASLDKIPPEIVPKNILQAARGGWDQALKQGRKSGFRNSQVTVLAPTGTIGLLMDCDTTGIEPDFALVKFKKLAGGGNFKMMNQSVPLALKNLGYTGKEIQDIQKYLLETQMIEGAPHLRKEHLAIFDCASPCGLPGGVLGHRFIAPMGHVRMMAAVQPFLSGAISKTVNLPRNTSIEQIQEIYEQAWKLGLKSIAVYRDGCKLSQPLSTQLEQVGVKAQTVDMRPCESCGVPTVQAGACYKCLNCGSTTGCS